MANVTTFLRLREALSSHLHPSSLGSSASSIVTLSSSSSSSSSSFLFRSPATSFSSAQNHRFMGTLNGGQVPYSKRLIRSKRPKLVQNWLSYNDPKLQPKFLRYAERIGRETGVNEELQAFDNAAATFPNKPKIIAATILERNNVIMRDLDVWENDFLWFKYNLEQQRAKQYPTSLMDMWQASEKVLGGNSGGAGEGDNAKTEKKDGKGDKKGTNDTSSSSTAATTESEASSSSSQNSTEEASLDSFYERTGPTSTVATTAKGIQTSPRITAADQIHDVRSLDRAYSQRLALVVKEKLTDQWMFPGGEVYEGEPIRQAAERWMKTYFGNDSKTDLWFLGNAPIGHYLRVYSPEVQKQLQCYGEKIYYFRAEILSGRFRLPKKNEKRTVPYTDFQWLTRDETETVFDRPFYKYAHQIIGSGAGEEFARYTQWKAMLEKKGIKMNTAVARRSQRELYQKKTGIRFPLIATRADAEIVAMKYSKEKETVQMKAVNRYYDRVRETRLLSAQIRKSLADKPMVTIIAQKLALAGANKSQVLQ